MFGLNKTYKINFITNSNEVIEPMTLKNKELIKDLPTISKDGYKFAGWYIDKECNNVFNQEKMAKNDITVYAKWDRMSMDEFLNEVNFYTKSSNILKDLQNDYSDVPQFKDDTNKDAKSTKKKNTKKKATKTKKSLKANKEETNVDEVLEDDSIEEVNEEQATINEAIEEDDTKGEE